MTAPVTAGELRVVGDRVHLTLTLALDRLKTGNFIMEAAARTLVKRHDAHALGYAGHGSATGSPWQVSGAAEAGDVSVELDLTITPIGPSDPMAEIELVGSANVGTVHLPLPGLGTVEDFAFDVDARLALLPGGE